MAGERVPFGTKYHRIRDEVRKELVEYLGLQINWLIGRPRSKTDRSRSSSNFGQIQFRNLWRIQPIRRLEIYDLRRPACRRLISFLP
jgi:hypothetical protein